jgi:hypothetical protein
VIIRRLTTTRRPPLPSARAALRQPACGGHGLRYPVKLSRKWDNKHEAKQADIPVKLSPFWDSYQLAAWVLAAWLSGCLPVLAPARPISLAPLPRKP